MRFERQVDALLQDALVLAAKTPLSREERRQAEHIAYDMQLVWDRYVRKLILASATGLASDNAGPIAASVPRRHRTIEAAGHLLVSTYKKRTSEPDWYRPADAIDAAHRLHITNFVKISAAMGSTPWLLDDLRLVRNFFAHRSKRSALEVRNMAWFNSASKISAESTMFTYETGGILRIQAWADFMKLIAQASL